MPRTANRVIKNTAYLYVQMGIQVFLSLYTTRLVLNALGAMDFGIYGIIGSAIALLAVLRVGMASSTQRFISFAEGERDEENKATIFASSLVLHIGIASIIFFVLEISSFFLFNGIFNIPDNRVAAAKFIYQCAIISVTLSVISSPFEGLINAHENMFYFSVIGVLSSFLKLSAAIFLSFYGEDKLCLYGFSMTFITLLVALLLVYYCIRKYKEARLFLIKSADYTVMKQMAVFAGWDGIGTISWVLFHQGNAIILNHFFGTLYNAAHSLAYQLSGQLGALGNNALKALNPVIVKDAGARDYKRMCYATRIGNSMSFFLISLCNLPVLVHLEILLKWWLQEIPVNTEIFIYLYFTAVLLESTSICLPVALRGVGKIKEFQLWCSICNLISPVVIVCLFVLGFSPYVIYEVMIASSLVKLIIRIYFANKECQMPMINMIIDAGRSIFAFVLGIAIAFILKNLIPTINPIVVFVHLLTDIVIYSLIFYLIGFNNSDRMYIKSLFKDLASKLT